MKFLVSQLKRFFCSGIFQIIVVVILFAAPWYHPYLRELKGHNLFLRVDSLILLGGALLLGRISQWWMPDRFTSGIEKLFQFVRARFVILGLLFMVSLLMGLLWINRNILHSFMNSADEHSCYFLAECFRMGKWWVEPHPLSEFFDVVHVGNRDGKWFSVYPFGWPLIMAFGLEWNILDWFNPVITIIAVILLFKVGQKLYGFSSAWLGVFLAVLTPYFTFTAASYFSHTTCFLMVALFSYSYLKWGEAKEESKDMLWAGLAAFAVGYGMATRYLTMAAFAAPFLIYRFWPVLTRREKIRRSHILVLAILGAFMLLIFYQNYVVTGKFYKAPNRYDKSWERLGFRDFYTPLDGIVFILARFFYLIDWMPPLFLILFFISIFQRHVETVEQKLFRYAFFYPLIAYFFYFSWGGNQYGPRYYYEAFPFLVLTLSGGLRGWWKESNDARRKFLIGAILFSLATSGYYFYKHGRFFDEASSQRKALYDLAEETLEEPAVVYIHGFLGQKLVMAEEDAVRNSPALDRKVLYAHDRGEKNRKLRDYYPDRVHYLGYYEREKKKAVLQKL